MGGKEGQNTIEVRAIYVQSCKKKDEEEDSRGPEKKKTAIILSPIIRSQ